MMEKPAVQPLVFDHPTRPMPTALVSVDGTNPELLHVSVRRSRIAPGRVKVRFVHALPGADGGLVALPVAEFRIELN